MYTQNGPLKKLMNTDDDLNYTTWYLVAVAPLVDAPSLVVHLPCFAPECRTTSDLKFARTTAPGKTSYCAQFFPNLERLFTFIFCTEIGSLSHRKWIFFLCFFEDDFLKLSLRRGASNLSLTKIASSLLLH
jgi:hypothetical protein